MPLAVDDVGHERLEHERSPPGARSARDALRGTRRWAASVGEVEERVEGDEHDGERAVASASVELGHVADGDRDRRAAGLGPQPRRASPSDASMPWTSSPRSTSGRARRPEPTPSSSTGPPPARRDQRGHPVGAGGRVGDVAVPVVVDVGEAVAVGAGVVALHALPVWPVWGRAARLAAVDWHYLDHAAGSPARPEAVAAMRRRCSPRAPATRPAATRWPARPATALDEPASPPRRGRRAAAPGEVVFTSGGTEADNLAVRGVLGARGGTVVCAAGEHHAVLHAGRAGRRPHGRRSTAAAWSTSTRWPRRWTPTSRSCRCCSSTTRSARSRLVADRRGGARPSAPGASLHTDAAQALVVARRGRGTRRRPTSSPSPSHKCGGPEGRRRARRARRRRARGRSSSAGARSAIGAAARRTSPARSASRLAAELAAVGARRRSSSAATAWRDAARRRACWPPSPGAIDSAVPAARATDHLVPGIVHLCLPGGRQRGAAVPARARPPRARGGRLELRERRAGPVARARRARHRRERWPAGRCGSRSGGPPPTPTSSRRRGGPARGRRPPRGPTPRRGAGMRRERCSSPCRAASTRRSPPRCCSRRATTSSGVTLKLWGGDCDRGCCSVADVDDARSVAAPPRHRPPRLQLRRRLRRARRGARTSPTTPPGARRTRASSATATSSSTACCAGPTPSASTPSPPATTPASSSGPTAPARRPRRRPGQGPVLRGAHARPGRARPGALPGRRPDQGRRARPRPPAAGLATADKPDSQDVCFITATGGRDRVPRRPHPDATPGTVVDRRRPDGRRRASRRARHDRPAPRPRPARRRRIRSTRSPSTSRAPRSRSAPRPTCSSTACELDALAWVAGPVDGPLLAQCSAARRAPPRCRGRRRRGRVGRARPPRRPGPERRPLRRRRGRAPAPRARQPAAQRSGWSRRTDRRRRLRSAAIGGLTTRGGAADVPPTARGGC